jgi:hypothetical protein
MDHVMDLQIAFSGGAFKKLIRYRIVDGFRPATSPVNYPLNTQSWLDGIIVTNLELTRVRNDRVLIMNEVAADGTVVPNQLAQGFESTAVTIDVEATVFLARIQDVAAAGLAQPPAQAVNVPTGIMHITVRLDVGSDGIPVIQMQLDQKPLVGLGIPEDVITGIAASASASIPFDVAKALNSILPPGIAKVLNAVITLDDAGAVLMRFEFADAAPRPLLDRFLEWRAFCDGQPQANLGTQDWCVSLDGTAIAAMVATKVDPLIKDKKPVHFNGGSSWSFGRGFSFTTGVTSPRAVIKKTGYIENACAGNDVRFDAFLNVDFSVPKNNLFRGTLSFDINKNGWDVAKCFGLMIVNPLFVLITLADQGEAGIGFVVAAFSLVFPVQPTAVAIGLGLLIAGVDQTLAAGLIDDQLKNKPIVTKDDKGNYAFDQAIQFANSLTRNWLVLKEAAEADGRLLLRGESRIPNAVLPRVRAEDLEGLSPWHLIDRCVPGKGQQTLGSLGLFLDPGYYVDEDPPPRIPTITLKYGRRTDGGYLMYQVLKDQLGIYQDPGSEYREIDYPGVPGTLAVKLEAATLHKAAFSAFAPAPYSLRLRFFTNGGVREYQFAAPPILTDFKETTLEAALRISRCKQLGTSLVLKRYLELLWLVDPPPVGRVAHQWEIHVRGLAPGRKATVWHGESSKPLVEAFADASGRVDVSLIVPHEERTESLVVGLDDLPFPTSRELHAPALGEEEITPADGVQVAVRQTVLTPIEHLDFDRPVEEISLMDAGERGRLVIRTQDGESHLHSFDSPQPPGLAVPARGRLESNDPRRGQYGQLAWRGAERRFTLLSDVSGRPEVIAEYAGRFAFDLAASRDGLLAQASADGTQVTVYRRGKPRESNPLEWMSEYESGRGPDQ